MKRICTLLGTFLGFILFLNPVLAAEDSSKIYDTAVDSIVYIETQDGTASGVIVKEDGTFVTAFHILPESEYIEIKTKDGKKYKATGYRYIDPKNDIAVLTVSSTKTFKPIKIAAKEPSIGQTVYTISNPKGLQFVFSNGMINQISKEDGKIQFSAPVSGGSSGGALLNSNGELIGIISSQFGPSKAQNINFAIPDKYFTCGLDKRKNINNKKQNWTDFLAERANKKLLYEYMDYGMENFIPELTYKSAKRAMEKTENPTPNQRLTLGVSSIIAYIYGGFKDETLIRDSKQALDELIKENQFMEAALYSRGFAALLTFEDKDYNACLKHLKKDYPRSYSFLKGGAKNMKASKDTDSLATILAKLSIYMKLLSDEANQ